MGIDASFETNPGEFLHWNGEPVISRAIVSLIENVMFYRLPREQVDDGDREHKELIAWFDAVTAAMHTDIALLENAVVFDWRYTEDQYETYVRDWERFLSEGHPGAPSTMTQAEYLRMCLDTWADITTMRETIDDLIAALEKTHAPDTWWYSRQYTFADLKLASRAMTEAAAQGCTRIRLFFS